MKKIKEKKIAVKNNKNLTKNIENLKIIEEVSKPKQIVNKDKAIPFGGGLTKEFVEKNWHLVRPCDPNEPLIKKPKKKSGSFFISNAYKYY
jgi:hypothetical protein